MTNHRAINVAAAVTTVASGCWLLLFLNPTPPAIDRRPHEELGQRLAAEAVRLLEPGARLVVIARDPEPFHVPASAAQLDGFMNALQEAGQTVSSFRLLKLDPLRLNAVPPGDFFDLLRRGRTNDVIVSFLGPPVLEPQQLAKLGARRLSVLAVCSGGTPSPAELKWLFDQRLLEVAIVSRDEATKKPAADSFEQRFRLVTASNVHEVLGTSAPGE